MGAWIWLILSLAFQTLLQENGQDNPVRVREEKVVVVASRLPQKIFGIDREVKIVEQSEMRKLPAPSVSDVLRYFLDSQERGYFGQQTDLSLRGSSFQQVLVLVDGIRVNDLQTAHHNLNLPLPVGALERIEILHGQGSALLGADAFGGAVNFVTGTPEKPGGSLRTALYDFGTSVVCGQLEFGRKEFSSLLAVEKNKSNGFMEDRDFDLFSAFHKISWQKEQKKLNLMLAGGRKEFGAYDFYTPGMGLPSREKTETSFLAASYETTIHSARFRQVFYFRHHFDRFILDRKRPEYYTNETTNRTYGTEFSMSFNNLVVGGEFTGEYFDSLRAGHHTAFRSSLFAEKRFSFGQRWQVSAGTRWDYHRLYGSSFSPQLSFAYLLWPQLKLRASAGYSFRAPSYTELYYQDPVNQGNPALKPERGLASEIGSDFVIGEVASFHFSAFVRAERNIIDWIKSPPGKWVAENLLRRRIQGVELRYLIRKKRYNLMFSSAFYHRVADDHDLILKYGHKTPQNLTSLMLNVIPLKQTSLLFSCLYKKRPEEKGFFLLDARISRKIGLFEIYFEMKNILDTEYEEVRGVTMPGRWAGAGLELRI
ncbi:MAG: TonB-dependent receptor [Candidatus Saccharicenans sp.]|nr:TonB-dependent receptor [Candidatus Saccharicenans sp.]MDI6849594.1 TonB-dependent receptor [Candidatus Saccharicenans sp.]